MPEPFRCGLILLAAGGSRRMGRPKQLLPIAGRPLLRHVAERLLAAPVSPVVVVLGANAAAIAPCLGGLALSTVINERWADGMGSSLRAGLQAMVRMAPKVDAVIVALADQPQSSAGHLAALLRAHAESGRPIIATTTAGGVALPPVLFAAEWFPRLLELEGDVGARQLLQENTGRMATVPLAAAADLDTPDDYDAYLRALAPGAAE
jgi:CTP:molybdopterin cytidylyltransferase MocA